MNKIKRNQKRKNIINSKQVFRISTKKNRWFKYEFYERKYFSKKTSNYEWKIFFSSLRSLLSVSVNFYEKISSDVDALNLLNFIELNFQSFSNYCDVLIFRFQIFNSRINFTQNIQSPSFDIIRNQNIQSLSFESSFVINRYRAELKYITSKNIFIWSQNFFSRSLFFLIVFFAFFIFRSKFVDRLIQH